MGDDVGPVVAIVGAAVVDIHWTIMRFTMTIKSHMIQQSIVLTFTVNSTFKQPTTHMIYQTASIKLQSILEHSPPPTHKQYTPRLHTSQTAILLILTYLIQKKDNLLEVGADVGLIVRATAVVIASETSVPTIATRAFPSFCMFSFVIRPKVVNIIAINHNA